MPYKAVLFDHDGTLVESEKLHWQNWQAALEPYQCTLSEAEYQAHFAGVPTLQNAKRLIETHGLKVSVPQLAQEKEAQTRLYLAQQAFPLMPHALEILHALRAQGTRLAVVTGAYPAAIQTTIKAYHLTDTFETVVTAADVVHSKPAPDCYLLALARLGLSAQECVAIEDTEHGVAAATAAGIDCCAVKNDYSAHHDFSRAIRVFSHLAEVQAWLEPRLAAS